MVLIMMGHILRVFAPSRYKNERCYTPPNTRYTQKCPRMTAVVAPMARYTAVCLPRCAYVRMNTC